MLAAISQKAHLTTKAVKSIMAAIVNSAARVSSKQLVRTLVSVCATQEQLDKLPGSVVKGLLAVPYVMLWSRLPGHESHSVFQGCRRRTCRCNGLDGRREVLEPAREQPHRSVSFAPALRQLSLNPITALTT